MLAKLTGVNFYYIVCTGVEMPTFLGILVILVLVVLTREAFHIWNDLR